MVLYRQVTIYNNLNKPIYNGLMSIDKVGDRIAHYIKTMYNRSMTVHIYANSNVINVYLED